MTLRQTYRSDGLYSRHRHNRALVATEGECTRPVEVRRTTMTDFGLEAAHRKISTEALVGKVLDAVATDDLFAAVLDHD